MPESSPLFDADIAAYFGATQHESVIDIGAGEGKFGAVIRGLQPRARLIAVEIDAQYVDQYNLRGLYDEVWVEDAAALIDRPDLAFSAVVIGDCIEHMRKSAGIDLINFLTYRCEIIIVKFPVAYVQDTWQGHHHEAHISVWSEYDFQGLDHVFAEEDFMRLGLVRGFRSRRARWLPDAFMKRFGYHDLRHFHERDIRPAGEPVGAAGHRRLRGSRWSVEQAEAYRRSEAVDEIASVVPAGERFILADQAELADEHLGRRSAVPFTERHGTYWGPPSDDAAAVNEFERLRRTGASFMIFAWPAFWWLDYYRDLNRQLRSRFSCVLQTERVIVFDLRSEAPCALAEPGVTRRHAE